MNETQAITFRLPADLYERLRREAFRQRKSMNELVVQGIQMRLNVQDWAEKQEGQS